MPDFVDMFGPAAAQYDAPKPDLSQVLQPSPVAPPANEQEAVQRKQGWKSFLTGLGQDPDAMRSLMMFGVQMLQPRAPGQSLGGQIGESLMHGQMAYDFAQQNKYERERQAREDAMKAETHQVGIRQTTAQTVGQEQENTIKAKAQDDILAEYRAKAAAAQSDQQKKAIELATLRKAEAMGLPIQEIQARIASERAQAGASTASARERTAAAVQTEMFNKAYGAMTPEKLLALKAEKGGKTGTALDQWYTDKAVDLLKDQGEEPTPDKLKRARDTIKALTEGKEVLPTQTVIRDPKTGKLILQ